MKRLGAPVLAAAAFFGIASAGPSGAAEQAADSHTTQSMSQVTIEAQRRSLERRVHTFEPELLLKKWRARHRHMFGPVPPRDGEGSIERFIHSERPLRVWYNTELADYYSTPAHTADFDLGNDFGGAPTINVWTNSHDSTEQGSRWQRSAIVTQVVHQLVDAEPGSTQTTP